MSELRTMFPIGRLYACRMIMVYMSVIIFYVIISNVEAEQRNITTIGGRNYPFVTIVRSNPEGIFIQGGEGVKFMRFRDLPTDIRVEFGYSPVKERIYLAELEKIRMKAAEEKARIERKRLKKEKKLKETVRKKKFNAMVFKEIGKVGAFLGTGFFITNDGYLLTCDHVVDGTDKISVVTADDKVYRAKVLKSNSTYDIALLKVSGTVPALPLSRQESANLGNEVFTVGYPDITVHGMSPKVTGGLISGLFGYQDDEKLYQISVPIQSGNSGGPLINHAGDVVGIVSSTLVRYGTLKNTGDVPQNVNYAVKSFYLHALLHFASEFPQGSLVAAKTEERSTEEIVEEVARATVLIIAR